MRRLLILSGFLLLPLVSMAHSVSTKEDVVRIVNKAVETIEKQGLNNTIQQVNDKTSPAFHQKDLYVFIYDMGEQGEQALCLAHGAKPELVGINLYDLKDVQGNFLLRNVIQKLRVSDTGEAWFEYVWPHPVTKKNTRKISYMKRVGETLMVGAGLYQ